MRCCSDSGRDEVSIALAWIFCKILCRLLIRLVQERKERD